MKIQKNLDLRTQRQQLEDEIQCLKNELYRWNDRVIEAKLALQEEEKKLEIIRENNSCLLGEGDLERTIYPGN